MPKTTILVENETREKLKQIGRKNQTYDDVINELVSSKIKKDSFDMLSPNSIQSTESVCQ